MEKTKNYSMEEVISSLNKKRGCRVITTKSKEGEIIDKIIEILKLDSLGNRNDVGQKSLGKIDFLTNYCGYKLKYVSKLTRIEY